MPVINRKTAARQFSSKWVNKGQEKQDDRRFWEELLSTVFGVANPWDYVQTQKPVQVDGTTKYIDVYIKRTEAPILIEQKSYTKSLDASYEQSDGTWLTPYEQALRYASCLPYGETPKWIITCNFKEFRIYDNERRGERGYEPTIVRLPGLAYEYQQLNILTDPTIIREIEETEISTEAGELVGKLYDALYKQYGLSGLDQRSSEYKTTLSNLNKLIVRIIFCFYSEDAEFFGPRGDEFTNYIEMDESNNRRSTAEVRNAMKRVFTILETPYGRRDPHEERRLSDFPYINGGLFADEIEVPEFTLEIKNLLIEECGKRFNWEKISPTIFGAVFESTLNPETRRSGGMHYTSIKNIRRVIDPLFMDDLRARFKMIVDRKKEDGGIMSGNEQREALQFFQEEISNLNFLDPACGSGNFLTEAYIELRTLENEILKLLGGNSVENPIKVSISQFYGIEINDFAVAVAKTALWIAEAQMFKATKEMFATNHLHGGDRWQFFPLQTNGSIVEGNALDISWGSIIRRRSISYIMGNPPFVGFTFQTAEQKRQMEIVFPGIKNLDYVCAWFKRACDYLRGSNAKCAFVATNSICQGETAARLWGIIKPTINFAYKPFIWENEASDEAHVHVVIIGFSYSNEGEKTLFDGDKKLQVQSISPYLFEGPNIIVKSRNKPLCSIKPMVYGNKPVDGGHFILSEQERDELIRLEPNSERFIKPFFGAQEFLHNEKRYVLWLCGAAPDEIAACPNVKRRIELVRQARLASPASAIRAFAETPTLFAQITQPVGVPALIVPCTSSQRRKYVPMAFVDGEGITNNLVQVVPNASIFEFAVLTSSVHMAWMRAFCGRLKSDYRYSKDVIYNTFPWPSLDDENKEELNQFGQAILDARSLYPNSDLSQLYDPSTMPPELTQAHRRNDEFVLSLYGLNTDATDEQIVTRLLSLYEAFIKEEERAQRSGRRARRNRHQAR